MRYAQLRGLSLKEQLVIHKARIDRTVATDPRGLGWAELFQTDLAHRVSRATATPRGPRIDTHDVPLMDRIALTNDADARETY